MSRPGGEAGAGEGGRDSAAPRGAPEPAAGARAQAAEGPPRFLMQSGGGGGARARGRGLSPLGSPPSPFRESSHPGTQTSQQLRAGPGRGRGRRGWWRGRRSPARWPGHRAPPPPARPPARSGRAPPVRSQKRPKFAGRDPQQPAPAVAPRAPSLPGIVRRLRSSAPRPPLRGGPRPAGRGEQGHRLGGHGRGPGPGRGAEAHSPNPGPGAAALRTADLPAGAPPPTPAPWRGARVPPACGWSCR